MGKECVGGNAALIRVNVVAEGKTEMKFAKELLNQFFGGKLIINARCVLTSRNNRTNYEYRGGLVSYRHAKNDILNWLKKDRSAYVTTMFDFYGLPHDFPGYEDAMHCPTPLERAEYLELKMKENINAVLADSVQDRFIPYIQLHEFEALLYTDLSLLEDDYLNADDIGAIRRLREETAGIPPEEINNGAETAPSKRLLKAIHYEKGATPVAWLEKITIDKIASCCPHFSAWIEKLSKLVPVE